MEDRLLHIHLCAGGLALSLPIPVISSRMKKTDIDSKTIILNRRKENPTDKRFPFFSSLKKNEYYFLRYDVFNKALPDDRPIPQEFKVKEKKKINEKVTHFELSENNIDESLPFKEEISNSHLLVTLSPDGNGRNYAIEKLKQIVSLAHPDQYIFIISCENGYKLTSSVYKEELCKVFDIQHLQHVYFLDSVVDRLVPKKWSFGATSAEEEEKILHIDTEKYYKWVIEYPKFDGDSEKNACLSLLDRFFDSELNENVYFVQNGAYDQEYFMKTFCVNGLHYAISIIQEYHYIKTQAEPGILNEALNSNSTLFPYVNRVIFELKSATISMITERSKVIGKEIEIEKVTRHVDKFMDMFIERLKLLNDERRRILNPLMRIAEKSHDIWSMLENAPKDLTITSCDKETLLSEIDGKIQNFVRTFSVKLQEYEDFMNLYEFEDKLVCRILQPINYIRFLSSDCNLLASKDATGNFELERIAILAHHVILDVFFRLKKIMKLKVACA